MVQTLPYPLAGPLVRYLQASDPDRLARAALEFIEGALAMAAYLAYAEYRCQDVPASRLLKGFTQRSLSPLLGLLRDCLSRMKTPWISAPWDVLFTGQLGVFVSTTCEQLNQFKHNKCDPASIDTLRLVQIVSNAAYKCFSRSAFGYFDDVKRKNFATGYSGLFRVCAGLPPFLDVRLYEGIESFSPDQSFVVDVESGSAIPLAPLAFFDFCDQHRGDSHGHCYLYDISTGSGFQYKAVGHDCVVTATEHSKYAPLWELMTKLKSSDDSGLAISDVRLRPYAEESL